MPRGLLKDIEYALSDVSGFFLKEYKRQKLTQEDIAEELGITQSCVSKKFKNDDWTLEEFMRMVRLLKLDEEQTVRLIRKVRV